MMVTFFTLIGTVREFKLKRLVKREICPYSGGGQRIMEIPQSYVYAGTKHAVRVMTEGLRRELRDMKTKIRVTVSLQCIIVMNST